MSFINDDKFIQQETDSTRKTNIIDPFPVDTDIEFVAPNGILYHGRVASKSGPSDYIVEIQPGESYIVPLGKLRKLNTNIKEAIQNVLMPEIKVISEYTLYNKHIASIQYKTKYPSDDQLLKWANTHFPDIRLVDAISHKDRNIDLIFEIVAAEDVRPQGGDSRTRAPGLMSEEIEGTGVITDRVPGGVADKMTSEDFDPKAIEKGIKVELEHTDDQELAKEIAMDHLSESPNYYDALEEMETKLEKSADVATTSTAYGFDILENSPDLQIFGKTFFIDVHSEAANELGHYKPAKMVAIVGRQDNTIYSYITDYADMDAVSNMQSISVEDPSRYDHILESYLNDMQSYLNEIALTPKKYAAAPGHAEDFKDMEKAAKWILSGFNSSNPEFYAIPYDTDIEGEGKDRKLRLRFKLHGRQNDSLRDIYISDSGVVSKDTPGAIEAQGFVEIDAEGNLPMVMLNTPSGEDRPVQEFNFNMRANKLASYDACVMLAEKVLTTHGGYSAEAQNDFDARLVKLAVDPSAKKYWTEYFGDYGRMWTRDIPKKKTKKKALGPYSFEYLEGREKIRPDLKQCPECGMSRATDFTEECPCGFNYQRCPECNRIVPNQADPCWNCGSNVTVEEPMEPKRTRLQERLQTVAYVKKVKGGWEVKSEKNPDWSGGIYKSKEAAEKRLKQVEMFKHMKKKSSHTAKIMCYGINNISKHALFPSVFPTKQKGPTKQELAQLKYVARSAIRQAFQQGDPKMYNLFNNIVYDFVQKNQQKFKNVNIQDPQFMGYAFYEALRSDPTTTREVENVLLTWPERKFKELKFEWLIPNLEEYGRGLVKEEEIEKATEEETAKMKEEAQESEEMVDEESDEPVMREAMKRKAKDEYEQLYKLFDEPEEEEEGLETREAVEDDVIRLLAAGHSVNEILLRVAGEDPNYRLIVADVLREVAPEQYEEWFQQFKEERVEPPPGEPVEREEIPYRAPVAIDAEQLAFNRMKVHEEFLDEIKDIIRRSPVFNEIREGNRPGEELTWGKSFNTVIDKLKSVSKDKLTSKRGPLYRITPKEITELESSYSDISRRKYEEELRKAKEGVEIIEKDEEGKEIKKVISYPEFLIKQYKEKKESLDKGTQERLDEVQQTINKLKEDPEKLYLEAEAIDRELSQLGLTSLYPYIFNIGWDFNFKGGFSDKEKNLIKNALPEAMITDEVMTSMATGKTSWKNMYDTIIDPRTDNKTRIKTEKNLKSQMWDHIWNNLSTYHAEEKEDAWEKADVPGKLFDYFSNQVFMQSAKNMVEQRQKDLGSTWMRSPYGIGEVFQEGLGITRRGQTEEQFRLGLHPSKREKKEIKKKPIVTPQQYEDIEQMELWKPEEFIGAEMYPTHYLEDQFMKLKMENPKAYEQLKNQLLSEISERSRSKLFEILAKRAAVPPQKSELEKRYDIIKNRLQELSSEQEELEAKDISPEQKEQALQEISAEESELKIQVSDVLEQMKKLKEEPAYYYGEETKLELLQEKKNKLRDTERKIDDKRIEYDKLSKLDPEQATPRLKELYEEILLLEDIKNDLEAELGKERKFVTHQPERLEQAKEIEEIQREKRRRVEEESEKRRKKEELAGRKELREEMLGRGFSDEQASELVSKIYKRYGLMPKEIRDIMRMYNAVNLNDIEKIMDRRPIARSGPFANAELQDILKDKRGPGWIERKSIAYSKHPETKFLGDALQWYLHKKAVDVLSNKEYKKWREPIISYYKKRRMVPIAEFEEAVKGAQKSESGRALMSMVVWLAEQNKLSKSIEAVKDALSQGIFEPGKKRERAQTLEKKKPIHPRMKRITPEGEEEIFTLDVMKEPIGVGEKTFGVLVKEITEKIGDPEDIINKWHYKELPSTPENRALDTALRNAKVHNLNGYIDFMAMYVDDFTNPSFVKQIKDEIKAEEKALEESITLNKHQERMKTLVQFSKRFNELFPNGIRGQTVDMLVAGVLEASPEERNGLITVIKTYLTPQRGDDKYEKQLKERTFNDFSKLVKGTNESNFDEMNEYVRNELESKEKGKLVFTLPEGFHTGRYTDMSIAEAIQEAMRLDYESAAENKESNHYSDLYKALTISYPKELNTFEKEYLAEQGTPPVQKKVVKKPEKTLEETLTLLPKEIPAEIMEKYESMPAEYAKKYKQLEKYNGMDIDEARMEAEDDGLSSELADYLADLKGMKVERAKTVREEESKERLLTEKEEALTEREKLLEELKRKKQTASKSEKDMKHSAEAGPGPHAYNAPGKDDKKDHGRKDNTAQQSRLRNRFDVVRMYSTTSSEDNGYVIMEISWDPEQFKDMSPQNIQHQVISYIKGLESDKYFHDFGVMGRPRIIEFDEDAGVARAKVRCSETRGIMTLSYGTKDDENKVPLQGIR